MLRKLNLYSHGYVLGAIVSSLNKIRFLDHLDQDKHVSVTSFMRTNDLSEGYLRISIQSLADIGWLNFDGDVVSHNSKTPIIKLFPESITELYSVSPESLLSHEGWQTTIPRLSEYFLVEMPGKIEYPILEILQGPLALPLLVGSKLNSLDRVDTLNNFFRDASNSNIATTFKQFGWLEDICAPWSLTKVGEFMISKALNLGVTASYWPLLNELHAVTSGDSRLFFSGHNTEELHIDRHLNVIASGHQHDKYFRQLEKRISEIFSSSELEGKPRYIVDVGCGDGTLLRRIYELLKSLEDTFGRPLIGEISLVGIDMNEEALAVARKTLADIPNTFFLIGDVGSPDQIIQSLAEVGATDVDQILHVRSFLDHERALQTAAPAAPANHPDILDTLAGSWGGIDADGVFVSSISLFSDLANHCRRWKTAIGKWGLLCLEVHSQSKWAKNTFIEIAEGHHFDTLQAFSKQYLSPPHLFLLAMAQNNLIASEYHKDFPNGFDFKRISLSHFCISDCSIDLITSRELRKLMRDSKARGTSWVSDSEEESASSNNYNCSDSFYFGLFCKNRGLIAQAQFKGISSEQDNSLKEIVKIAHVTSSACNETEGALFEQWLTRFFSLNDSIQCHFSST